jgi:ATP-dependent protease Clp ATPase subunit
VLATLEDLDEPALEHILVEPKNALVKRPVADPVLGTRRSK